MADDKDDKDWITVNGNHIPVGAGESKKAAYEKAFAERKGSKTLGEKYGKFEEYGLSLTNKSKVALSLSNEFKNTKEFKEEIINTLKKSNNVKDLEKIANKYAKWNKWSVSRVEKEEQKPVKFREAMGMGAPKQSILIYKLSSVDSIGNYRELRIKGINPDNKK